MSDEDLFGSVTAELDKLDASTSLFAKHLNTGRHVSVRASEPVDTLSVIKIPIMILAFRDVEGGGLDLSERYTISQEDVRNGTGILKQFTPGLQPTFGDIITQMIITSDNTATDIVISRVGFERVNELLSELGYIETRLQHTLAAYFRSRWELVDPANAELTNWEVFKHGFPRDAGASERDFLFEGTPAKWLGRSTAEEMARLFEQIQNAEVASRAHCDEMLEILKRQQSSSRLPQRISHRVAIGHKTGDWGPLAGNDAGIIYADSGAIVVSCFATQNRGDYAELEAAHGRVAEMLLDAWG